MILEKGKNSKVISKYIMAAQKRKKKLLTEFFCIFEQLPNQNQTNQDSQLS